MDRHVDIVKNQLQAGYSEVVARLYLANEGTEEEEITVSLRELPSSEGLRSFFDQPLPAERGPVYAVKNPREYLALLHERITNTYQFATELHSMVECPYRELWRAMEPAGTPPSASASHRTKTAR